MTTHKYPGVKTTIEAKVRREEVIVENPRVPFLFATIVANKGPLEVTKVRSIEELEEIYGKLDYMKQGQDVLNLYQWLGGSVPFNGYAWIKRIEPAFVEFDETTNDIKDYVEKMEAFGNVIGEFSVDTLEGGEGAFVLKFTSKDNDPIYADYTIKITQEKDRRKNIWKNVINLIVLDDKGRTVSQVNGINESNHEDQFKLLDYFNVEFDGVWFSDGVSLFGENKWSVSVELELDGTGTEKAGLHKDLTIDNVFKTIKAYYAYQARTELEDMLSYPISIILDGNYPVDIKQVIIDFISDIRDDVHFMLTRAIYKTNGGDQKIDPNLVVTDMEEAAFQSQILNIAGGMPAKGNVAIWAADRLRVRDAMSGDYVFVSSIYELASKIPENDYKYGIWYNFVGPRRGIVHSTVERTNTPYDKEVYTRDKTNYIEKTYRDQAFMLQRTTGTENTAYVQLHASRLTQYLRREITWIGRKYLFEYNDIDSTTYKDVRDEVKDFLNKFASIAIDMRNPYKLEVFKTSENGFTISITNLKYKDVVEFVDLYIQLD